MCEASSFQKEDIVIKLHFNFKDILRAGRLGFSFKKMSTALIGLVFITIIYNIFTYTSLIVAGKEFVKIWEYYKLLPIPLFMNSMVWYSWIIWGVGVFFSLVVLSITMTAISKITFEQLKGDEFYEISTAFKDSLKLWKSSFLSPIILLIFIAFLFLIGLAFGQLGKIAVVGPWFVGLLSILLVLGSFFIFYLLLIFIVSIFMSPPIAATTKGDSFDTLFEVFSVSNDQPWRWIVWEILVSIISIVGVAIYSYAMKFTLQIFKYAMEIPKGQEWWFNTWNYARNSLPVIPSFLRSLSGKVFPASWFDLPTLLNPSLQVNNPAIGPLVGGILLAIALYIIALSILALGISIFSSGQTLIYVVLVKIKDDRNLLSVKKDWSLDDDEIEDEENLDEETVEEKNEEEKEDVEQKKDEETEQE